MGYEEGSIVDDGLVITWQYGPCQAVFRCACGKVEKAEYKAICRGIRIREAELIGWARDRNAWTCPKCNKKAVEKAV